MKKLLTTKSHDCEVPMFVLISLIVCLHDFMAFVIVRFRQIIFRPVSLLKNKLLKFSVVLVQFQLVFRNPLGADSTYAVFGKRCNSDVI